MLGVRGAIDVDEKDFQQKQLDEQRAEIQRIYELIDKRFSEVCATIREVAAKMEDRYQTKEMCTKCSDDRERRICDLEKKYDKVQWGALVGVLYILYDLLKTKL